MKTITLDHKLAEAKKPQSDCPCKMISPRNCSVCLIALAGGKK
jgi:hypothetical protein